MTSRLARRCARLSAAMLLLATAAPALAQDRATGLVFADADDYRSLPLASVPMMGTLPTSKDLSRWFPPVGDQGAQASCVGWAVGYGLKSYQEAHERKASATPFSPSYIYNQIQRGGCAGGSRILDAMMLIRSSGAAPLAEFPYRPDSCTTQPDEATRQRARAYAVSDWRRVNVADPIEVKSQLAAGFPIVIGMIVDEAFMALRGPAPYRPGGASRGGHAMILVGYDDAKNAYRVFNSWGTAWGDGGYGWIAYDAFTPERVREAYAVQDIIIDNPRPVGPDPNPRPGPAPPPAPEVIPPVATLGAPQFAHNQQLGFMNGQPVWGMTISVPGQIRHAVGTQAQVVVRFQFANGRWLYANPQEHTYRDAHGWAATGTMKGPVINDPAELAGHVVAIPYYALNLQPTNFQVTHRLRMVAAVYLNDFEVARSQPTDFIVRW